MRTRLSLPTTLLAVCAGASLISCGDNLTPGSGDIDAADPNPDGGNTDAPDASTAPTVGGTLAIFDAILTDPSAAAVGGVRGGTIRFSFNDFTMNGGETIFGTSAIGGCLVTKFDATHLPNPRLDAGPITISGPATGDNALAKTLGPCSLQAAFGDPDPYACISHNQATATIGAQDLNALSPGAGAVAYTLAAPAVDFGMTTPVAITSVLRGPATLGPLTLPDETVLVTTTTAHGITSVAGNFVTITGVTDTSFNTPPGSGAPLGGIVSATQFIYSQAGTDGATSAGGMATATTGRMIGSTLVVNGLSDPTFNSGAGGFPIIGQINANTLLVVNSAPANNAAQAADTSSTYTILNGFSPVPSAADGRANFLNGSLAPNTANSIRIQKASNAVWPAIDVTIDVPGEARRPVGVTLTRASNVATGTTAAPHDFLVGQVLTIAGSTDPTFNTTSATVVAVPSTTTFTYANTGSDVAVGLAATAVKPGAFTLDGTSQQAHVFPTSGTATMLKYSCDNGTVGAANVFDDTCGDESTAILKAFIISGSATKKSIQGLFPFQMPTEIPGTDEWLEWQCAFIGGKSGTMPAAAVQAIIDFQPTRVEQQTLFVGGTILDGTGTNVQTLRVLSGHALAGHQTFCPRAETTVRASNLMTASRTGDIATVTTATAHGLMPGQMVTIAGATNTAFNGTFAVTGTSTANGSTNTFTFASVGTDIASATSAGTVTPAVARDGFAMDPCP
jgi:hypothetical protein